VSGNKLSVPLSTGLDQPTRLPQLSKVLAAVERNVNEAARKHNPKLAMELLDHLNGIGRVSAIATAKTLWMMRDQWELICPDAEDFEYFLFHKQGLAPDTVRRYIDAWDTIYTAETTSQNQFDALAQRPIADLIAISQYRNAHGSLSRDQVGELAAATDSSTVRKLLRKFKGLEEQNNHIQIVLEDDGSLVAWQNNKREELGYLRLDTDHDPAPALRQQAIEQLVRKARIREE